MRLDSHISTYAVRPLLRLTNSVNSSAYRIPILMYHNISDEKEDHLHPYFRLNTSPEVFRSHMSILKKNDYNVIGPSDVANLLRDKKKIQKKTAVVTFDDGYEDFYLHGFPIMAEYGYTATVYLPSAFIGKKFRGKKCLSWKQINELANEGINFGSHTVTHPQLYSLPGRTEVKSELRDSKNEIEDNLSAKISDFSYPYAFPEEHKEFNSMLTELLRELDYESNVTTIIGSRHESPYKLKRLPANSDDDKLLFESKLDGAYDWLHSLQLLSKMIKKMR